MYAIYLSLFLPPLPITFRNPTTLPSKPGKPLKWLPTEPSRFAAQKQEVWLGMLSAPMHCNSCVHRSASGNTEAPSTFRGCGVLAQSHSHSHPHHTSRLLCRTRHLASKDRRKEELVRQNRGLEFKGLPEGPFEGLKTGSEHAHGRNAGEMVCGWIICRERRIAMLAGCLVACAHTTHHTATQGPFLEGPAYLTTRRRDCEADEIANLRSHLILVRFGGVGGLMVAS